MNIFKTIIKEAMGNRKCFHSHFTDLSWDMVKIPFPSLC